MRTLSEEIEGYWEFLSMRGNSNLVKRMYCQRLKTFLKTNPEAMDVGAEALKASINSYIGSLATTSGKGVASAAVRFYWSYKTGKPFSLHYRQSDYEADPSIDAEVAAFSVYLSSVGVSESSVRDRVNSVRRFLYRMFHGAGFSRSLVTVEAVRDYLSVDRAHNKQTTKSGIATSIRRYAKFLATVGYERNADALMRLPIASYQRHGGKLPGCISDEDYRHLIESFDTTCERGARDRAMTLCMGNLGLRGSDVAKLNLENIDWMNGTLTVRDSKSISARSIPLDAETGAALEVYVASFRPRSPGKPLFMATGGERGVGGIMPNQVHGAITLAAEKAGIADFHGTHTLRRSVATRMVNGGVGIKVIADILGHEQITTTMGYLRVDLARLRKVAASWPEEVRHA